MIANRMESATSAGAQADEGMSGAVAGTAPAAKGGMGAWLPLILNIVLLPALAYVMTVYVLVPKLTKSISAPASADAVKAKGPGEKSAHGKGGAGEAKITAPMSGKVLVNVAGTMGTRYLLANITMVSHDTNLKSLVDKHDAQLRDAAASTLASKTIADLEKPGARNLIRTELISVFNSILGSGVVTEIYLTEFAIQ